MIKKRGIIYCIALAIFTLASTFSATFAWFYSTITLSKSDIDMSGSSSAAYFAYGDGLPYQEDENGNVIHRPYGIRTPVHLYNLAWLQYAGIFNKDRNSDGTLDQQFYFEIDNSIEELDMTGWTLPPIGTETYPFLGNFNGNNKVVKNLTISNKAGLSKPASIAYNVQPQVVGFFGVIGEITHSLNYTTSTNSIYNVTLDSITVESKTQQTLIGLAGGYVNGNISGVKIDGTSKIDLSGQAHTIKNNIPGIDNLSDYALVGYSKNKGSSSNLFSQDVSQFFHAGGKGHTTTEGGTFKSRDYMEWIFNTKGSYSDNDDIHTRTVSGNGGYNIVNSLVMNYDKNPTTSSEKNLVYRLRDNTYIPLVFNPDNFKTTTTPKAASYNTGYLVGSDVTFGTNNASPKLGAYKRRNLINSLYDTNINYNNMSRVYEGRDMNNNKMNDQEAECAFNNNKVEILTYSLNEVGNKTEKHWVRIQDKYNSGHGSSSSALSNYYKGNASASGKDGLNLQKYDEAREQLPSFFTDSNYVHGIHFDTNLISKDSLTTIPANTAYAGGSLVTSTYQVPKGSIDFKLSTTGYINFFAGTYGSNDVNTMDFFSLYHVVRKANKTIDSINMIGKIYLNKNYDEDTNPTKYIYGYVASKTGSVTGYSKIVVNGVERTARTDDFNSSTGLVFDVQTALMTACKVKNALYYFEVPANNDEFAMGASSNATGGGAYLIYLDLQTNASTPDTDEISSYAITTRAGGNEYPYGVDFAISSLGNKTGGGQTFGLIITTTSSNGAVTLEVSGNTVYYQSTITTQYAYQTISIQKKTESQVLPTAPPSSSTYGTRVITTTVVSVELVPKHWTIVMTGDLNSDLEVPSYTYTSIICDGDALNEGALPDSFTTVLNAIKENAATKVVTITRRNGSGNATFNAVPAYSETGYTTVDFTMDIGTLILDISNVAEGYTVKINGVRVSNDPPTNVYPQS